MTDPTWIVLEGATDGRVRENVRAFRDQGGFPRYVWAKLDGTWFEERLVNATAGTYKGYPVTEASIPRELRERVS